MLAREEAADLLNNPLRNGVLLSDLMTVLVGAPPLGRRDRCPRTLAVARANVERALVPLRTMPGAIPDADVVHRGHAQGPRGRTSSAAGT